MKALGIAAAVLSLANATVWSRWHSGGLAPAKTEGIARRSRAGAEQVVDEDLYSRQLLTFGRDAQRRLSQGRVLVVGCGGVGIEVCKNLALAGVSSMSIRDETPISEGEWQCMPCSGDDVGLSRSSACAPRVGELNPYCEVKELIADATVLLELIKGGEFDCVAACSVDGELAASLSSACREAGVGFVYAAVQDATRIVVADDFGENFESIDREPVGSALEPKLIESLDSMGTDSTYRLRLAGGEKHDCQVDDHIAIFGEEWIVKKVVRPDVIIVQGGPPPEAAQERVSMTILPGRLHTSCPVLRVEETLLDLEEATPLRAVAGGIAAHEVLKYLARGLLGPPAVRWSLDTSEELPHVADEAARLRSATVFVVGAGATGCELLKNLALMGVGRVVVADDDTIETSNLNRQFLFRKHDVGKSKAVVAASVAGTVRRRGQSTSMLGIEKRVEPKTAEFFERTALAGACCVFLALDNVEARRFVDKMCVAASLPLIDTGTLGARGSVQVCIPHQTETYGNAQDPDDSRDAVPVCTLKQHPFKLDHVVAWATDLYAGYFARRITRFRNLLEAYLAHAGGVRAWLRSAETDADGESVLEQALEDAEDIRSCLVAPATVAKRLASWAGREYARHFRSAVDALTARRPRDARDDDEPEFPYWSGTRVWPERAGAIDEPDFVFAAISLRLAAFGISQPVFDNDADLLQVAQDAFDQSTYDSSATVEALELSLARLVHATTECSLLDTLAQLTFDKDDAVDLAFVTAAANARAAVFSIPKTDTLRCKQIAGRVVPAVATTTSVVSGLAAFEFLKLMLRGERWSDRIHHRNSFINLALLDRTTRAEPFPCESWTLPDGRLVSDWSPRSNLFVPRDSSLPQLLDLILAEFFDQSQLDVHVASITRQIDGRLIYVPAAAILFADALAVDLLLATEGEDDRIEQVKPDESHAAHVDVLVTVASGVYKDEEDDDIQDHDAPLPPIRLWFDDEARRSAAALEYS